MCAAYRVRIALVERLIVRALALVSLSDILGRYSLLYISSDITDKLVIAISHRYLGNRVANYKAEIIIYSRYYLYK